MMREEQQRALRRDELIAANKRSDARVDHKRRMRYLTQQQREQQLLEQMEQVRCAASCCSRFCFRLLFPCVSALCLCLGLSLSLSFSASLAHSMRVLVCVRSLSLAGLFALKSLFFRLFFTHTRDTAASTRPSRGRAAPHYGDAGSTRAGGRSRRPAP
eukprot:m.51742 g.51742  ORF g.51742 m.51742 type:complete len:158 (-) comp6637_c0_seq1:1302-1775(-)